MKINVLLLLLILPFFSFGQKTLSSEAAAKLLEQIQQQYNAYDNLTLNGHMIAKDENNTLKAQLWLTLSGNQYYSKFFVEALQDEMIEVCNGQKKWVKNSVNDKFRVYDYQPKPEKFMNNPSTIYKIEEYKNYFNAYVIIEQGETYDIYFKQAEDKVTEYSSAVLTYNKTKLKLQKVIIAEEVTFTFEECVANRELSDDFFVRAEKD